MIGIFPDPLPDELLYGAFARYTDIMKFNNLKGVHYQLFGLYDLRSIIELPTHIDSLIEHLPEGHQYTPEKVINYNTLLPYYASFLPSERVDKIKELMRGEDGKAVYLLSGITAYSISKPNILKYCPKCIKDDVDIYGSAYWHRVHQLPGVEVCTRHHVLLNYSDVQINNRRTLHSYHCPPVINNEHVVPVNVHQKEDRQLLRIAEDSQWLMDNTVENMDMNELYHTIKNRLKSEGWLSLSGKTVYINELKKQFIEYFSPSLLNQLQCCIDDNSQSTWLERLIRKPRVLQHPLHYILLIHFLRESVQDFFIRYKSISNIENNEECLAPCLNKVSDHFQKLTVKLQINTIHMKKERLFYSCPLCGFSYTKSKTSSKIKVVDYGWLWKEKLSSIANEPSFSLRQISGVMGADPKTIQRYMDIEELSNCEKENKEDLISSEIKHPQNDETLQNYRSSWNALCKNYPGYSRKELRMQLPGVFMWLYRNDREWLEQNLPTPKKPKATKERIDWDERDVQLRKRAEEIVCSIKNTPGKPIKITISEISRQLEHLSRIQNNRDKLPETWSYMQSVAESRLDFACRRIWWVVEKHRQQCELPPIWKIIKEAGIREDLIKELYPTIEKAYKSIEYYYPVKD